MTDKKRPKQGPKPVVDPKHDAPIVLADQTQASDDLKLDTGMRVKEAIAQARFWWDNKGRKLIKDKNFATDNPGYGSFNPNPKTVEEAKNWIPSGIMEGKLFADLTKQEQLTVTKQWHHQNVRVANIDPEEYLRAVKQPGTCFYCTERACADEHLPNGEYRELCWSHFMNRYPEEAKVVFTEKEGFNDNDAEK